MFDLKIVSLFSFILIIKEIESQSLIRGQQSPIDRLPGVGACDRIAARGVGNCMKNFLPTNVLSGFTGDSGGERGSGGICCSYSKYKACINGLHTGLRIAMERERCPKSYSAKIIKSMGDSNVGLPLKSFCGNGNGGRSQCPKSGNSKPKKNPKQPKREDRVPGPSETIGDTFGGAFQPVRDIFERGTGSRQNTNPIEGVFQPVRDIFDRGTGAGNRNNKDRDNNNPSLLSPVGDVFNKGRETFEQGAQSFIGGVQSAFGSLGNFGKNSNPLN